MSFEFFIGSRYLKIRQKQSFISLITILSIAGVAVGVMALIVVIAVMSGFESDLKSRILSVESHLVLMRYGKPFSDYQKIVKYIEKCEGIEAATPFVQTQAMLRSSFGISGTVLRGIDPQSAGKVIKTLDNFCLKSLQNAKSPTIILGAQLAKNLSVTKGDAIYVISPKGMLSPIGHIPAMKQFKVAGFFESGMYEYDSSIAYTNLQDAQKILRMEDSITGVETRVHDVYDAKNIGQAIIAGLTKKYNDRSYWAKDWMRVNHNLFSALKLEKTVMFIILALIVLVAAFNIASSLIMTVMEKTKDIAILKAMGATNKSIGKIFVFKGMVIGFLGTFIGTILGFLLCALLKHYKFIELPGDVYYISTLPVLLEGLDILIIVFGALIICFLATLYPARQASKLNPVEAIRYG